MTGANGHGVDDDDEMLDTEEYNEMMLLDRLESLEDEMVELKVNTLDEVRARIREMHTKLGE
ncbi:MAG TPA: hypothetical protein VF792_00115 [Ktedonobacterales bacterium]